MTQREFTVNLQSEMPLVYQCPVEANKPLRVGDCSVGRDSYEPVGHGHGVQVALLPVQDVGVGPPDLVEELPVHDELFEVLAAVVAQPLVAPKLSEVAVHGERLLLLVHGTHGANHHVDLRGRVKGKGDYGPH